MAVPVRDVAKYVVKNVPTVLAALATVRTFVNDHPGTPTWFRDQFDDLGKRIAAVQKQYGDAARIRGMLVIVRDVAHQMDAHGDRWISRADNIEQRVRLAEARPRPGQKKALAAIAKETDELLAHLIEETARLGSNAWTEAGRTGPQAP